MDDDVCAFAAAAAAVAVVSSIYSPRPPPPRRRQQPPPPPRRAPIVDEAQAQQGQAGSRGPDGDRSQKNQGLERGSHLRVEPSGDARAQHRGQGSPGLLREQAGQLRVEPGRVEGRGSGRGPASRGVPVAVFRCCLFVGKRKRRSRLSFFDAIKMMRKKTRPKTFRSPRQCPQFGLRELKRMEPRVLWGRRGRRRDAAAVVCGGIHGTRRQCRQR